MSGETPPGSDAAFDLEFMELLREAFISMSKGDFEVRLKRHHDRGTQDTIAFLFNLTIEELGELFEQRAEDRRHMQALIETATDVLVRIGAGDFGARVERSFDGSPEDVLAYLVNNAAEELSGLFAELEQKNALLEEQATRQALAERIAYTTLSAGVGHELNNPLSYAAGNLEFLEIELGQLQGLDPEHLEELRSAIADARTGVSRASRIAADLKSLTPSVTMVFEDHDVQELVESSLALIRNAVQHRARLQYHFDEVPRIRADRGRLGQVLVNLVQNALHALPEDRCTEDNHVEVAVARYSERMVSIEVRDNGEGISMENRSRIFDSFFTTRPVGKGTGLGLALSKRMIADHGGRIEVESEFGVGSTFRLLLPISAPLSS